MQWRGGDGVAVVAVVVVLLVVAVAAAAGAVVVVVVVVVMVMAWWVVVAVVVAAAGVVAVAASAVLAQGMAGRLEVQTFSTDGEAACVQQLVVQNGFDDECQGNTTRLASLGHTLITTTTQGLKLPSTLLQRSSEVISAFPSTLQSFYPNVV
jgi:hypothetical protein